MFWKRLDLFASALATVILSVLAIVLFVGTLIAQSVTAGQLLSIPTTAVGLTGVAGATFCRGILEGGNARMALDGSTPTALAGRPIFPGDRLRLNNADDITRFKVIAISPNAAKISMSCGSGTPAGISEIDSPPTNSNLPVCNALTRPGGNCR